MRSLTSLLLVALLPGCVERALGEPEGGVVDMSHAPGVDLGAGDLSACGNGHAYATVPLASVVTLDGKDTFSPTAAVRVIVRFEARSCDVPADLLVEVLPGNATTAIDLTAHLWKGSVGCSASSTVVREVTVSASQAQNQIIVVRDKTTPTSEPLLVLTAAGGFSPMCTAKMPGESCDDDCDCNDADPATLCLSRTDGTRRCGRPCHEDAECRLNGEASFCAGDDWTCVQSQACRSAVSCPVGDTVIDCRCTPYYPLPHPAPPFCGCDAECPEGTICGGGSCVQPCTGMHGCGTYGGGEGGTGCFDGVCVQFV
jgi:hypothetical protein